ncbi:MAG: hypothetical protein WA783_19070 [Phormidesmis sp.]
MHIIKTYVGALPFGANCVCAIAISLSLMRSAKTETLQPVDRKNVARSNQIHQAARPTVQVL